MDCMYFIASKQQLNVTEEPTLAYIHISAGYAVTEDRQKAQDCKSTSHTHCADLRGAETWNE